MAPHFHRLRTAFAGAAFAAALGCAALQPAPSAAPAGQTPAAPSGRAVAAPAAPEPGAAAPAVAQGEAASGISAVNLVDLVAKPGLWPLDVEAAQRIFQALGPVTREVRGDDELTLAGGPSGEMQHFALSYSRDDQYWVFGSAGFLIAGADTPGLRSALERELTERLGKPLWTEAADSGHPKSAWDIGEGMALSLSVTENGAERSVRIAITDRNSTRTAKR